MSDPGLYRLPTSTRARRRTIVVACLGVAGVIAALAACVAGSRIAFLAGLPAGLGVPLTRPLPGVLRIVLVGGAANGLGVVLLLRRWRHLPLAVLGVAATALLAGYRLYPPASYFLARRALGGTELQHLVASGERWGMATALLCITAVLPFLPGLIQALVRTGDLHGSARLARPEDILKAGFLFDDPAKLLSQSRRFRSATSRLTGDSGSSVP